MHPVPETRRRICAGLAALAFLLLPLQTRAQEADGVRMDSGILVFESQDAFDAITEDLRNRGGRRFLDLDRVLEDFEARLDFSSLRGVIRDLEEHRSSLREDPPLAVDDFWLLDPVLQSVLSPQGELIIGGTGYLVREHLTFELPNIGAPELAALRRSDLRTSRDIFIRPHTRAAEGTPCVQGFLSCNNITTYDGGARRFKSEIGIQDYAFSSSVVVTTKNQKKSLGIWWNSKADQIWAWGDGQRTDALCNTIVGTYSVGEARSNKRKATDTDSIPNGHPWTLITDHGVQEEGITCSRANDAFNCDRATRGCDEDQPPPSTGLHIRTKFAEAAGTWTAASANPGDGPGVHTYPTLTGDIDNDQRMDLIFIGQNWNGAGLNIRTQRSNGDGTWTFVSDILGDGAGVHTYPALTGDLNLDGRTDLIFVGQNWSGAGLNIRGKCSNGDGTWTPCWNQVMGDGAGVHTYPTLTGDVDNDGRTDLIFVGQNWSGAGLNIRVKRANPGGTWTPWFATLGDGPGVHTYPTLLGDLNQDDRTDLIFIGQNWNGTGLNVRGKCSNGAGGWSPCWNQVLADGPGVHTYPALTGDVDNDGRTDLVFVGQNW